jgi:ABC-type uncharacterized transport system permease subunit
VLAGCFFGWAGLFQLSRLRQGDPTVAVGLELDIIAAVIIGGASLSGGAGTILGSMIGALIMAVLRNGSPPMGWPTYFQEIIIGLVIIGAGCLDRLRQGRAANQPRRPAIATLRGMARLAAHGRVPRGPAGAHAEETELPDRRRLARLPSPLPARARAARHV